MIDMERRNNMSDMKMGCIYRYDLEKNPQDVGCTDCCGQRDNTIYTYSGKMRTALFCPTCGRKLQN